jgi:hypothetical protein
MSGIMVSVGKSCLRLEYRRFLKYFLKTGLRTTKEQWDFFCFILNSGFRPNTSSQITYQLLIPRNLVKTPFPGNLKILSTYNYGEREPQYIAMTPHEET